MVTIKHTPQSIAELEREREQFKLERDSLIEDVEKLRKSIENYKLAIKELKFGNDALRLQSDEYFNLWQDVDCKYKNLTEHIKLKAENNPSVSRYINLVLYIDDLEADTHEG
ncbi:hypothetical protein [Mammaliicoccus fleurettii]|uniref:hypothetical protein n=1 Tax=Mammaliicoccus fleurettii TaxID=150056 RepID=UPI002DB62B7A|nr:hypothetical protein [Mammaliicoccus fleurettii]MEB7723411.1 hypothetical protein [Mammaliicoccus fleurettii]